MEIENEENGPEEQFNQTDTEKRRNASRGARTAVAMLGVRLRRHRANAVEVHGRQRVEREMREEIDQKAIEQTTEGKQREELQGQLKVNAEKSKASVDQREKSIGETEKG